MPFFKDRHESVDTQQPFSGAAIEAPAPVDELSPTEQLPFPEQKPFPDSGSLAGNTPIPPVLSAFSAPDESAVSRAATRQLPDVLNATRALPELQTGALRQPVVIRGSGKKPATAPQTDALPSRTRHWIRHVTVLTLIFVIVVGALIVGIPLSNVNGQGGPNSASSFNPLQWFDSNSSNNTKLNVTAMRAATATAISGKGYYDPGGSSPVVGSGSGDPFPYGQCTYWADYRYHQLTGVWVPWGGNADAWYQGALANGWHTSTQPHYPSIVVLMPGVQGAGPVGHVAVAEYPSKDGGAVSSNMNWYANGGWGVVSYWTFYPGSGVYFVWV